MVEGQQRTISPDYIEFARLVSDNLKENFLGFLYRYIRQHKLHPQAAIHVFFLCFFFFFFLFVCFFLTNHYGFNNLGSELPKDYFCQIILTLPVVSD